MEGSDEVFALRRVDRGLAADRGIDLGQQRGGDLNVASATPQDARCEAGQVADHPAAERNDKIGSLRSQFQQSLAQGSELAEALGRLAGLQDNGAGVTSDRLQPGFQGAEMVSRDILVGDDRTATLADVAFDRRCGTIEQSRPDQDVIGAVAERHVYPAGASNAGAAAAPSSAQSAGGHVCWISSLSDNAGEAGGLGASGPARSPPRISLTIASCGTSRLSIVMSASA